MTSTRAQVITRRTYNRPLENETFETWEQTVDRVITHQEWLWERAQKNKLNKKQKAELEKLKDIMMKRQGVMAGRTLWLGGTEVAKQREISQFNCSFTEVASVSDIVDVIWLLLNGCGVGFKPRTGNLSGFLKPVRNIRVTRSERTKKGGVEKNVETYEPGNIDPKDLHNSGGTWTIKVGDSAEAWAKAVGKLLAGKYPCHELHLDFSEIRPAGERLAGYGWISAGDEAICKAFVAIANLLSLRAGQLLTVIDILDIVNWLGTILSSRRSAEIALVEYGDPEWKDFALAKKNFWEHEPQRAQSNNSLLFYSRPSRQQLQEIFDLMLDAGGSEPGFINGSAAKARAPWFSGVNPCAEILLSSKSVCNLVEIDVAKFGSDIESLHEAAKIMARANYRQTCVNFNDGVLQTQWHQNNEFLRLCGVGLTGIVKSKLSPYDYKTLKNIVVQAAFSMADELHLPRPKNTTTIKPSGTVSKIMDTTEGCHKPLGRYIFNNVNFSKYDPVLKHLKSAGYRIFENPLDKDAMLVTFPVEYNDVQFDVVDGKYVNLESAIDQLERYKVLMSNYVEQNCSITISYSPDEVGDIIDWLIRNWDTYVGVSFILRNDPTKTAQDLGYLYLPQEVVTQEKYEEYVSQIEDVNLDETVGTADFDDLSDDECATGACPVR
tara:strand:+ start:10281 stop:12269 length:1989 start_codon:yes stop_codon:yes gene_type:complete